jgi:acyl-CoA synthetase (AMP-forming)/AMP-acid ligase II
MTDWTQTARKMRREALYGDRVALCYPVRPQSIGELIDTAVETQSTGEALVCGDERLTWTELGRRSAGLSGWLAARGIGRGDRVALLLGNGWPFVVGLFAIARIGAIAVPVSVKVSKPELEYVLEDSAAAALLYDPAFVAAVPPPKLIETLKVCAAFAGAEARQMMSGPAAASYAGDEQDVALIIYTSGTTGRPKGAMITHLGVAHSAMNYVACMGLDAQDRFLVAVPMSNITGIVALILTATLAGGTMVVMPEFHASTFLALAAAEKATHALLVPAMYNLCVLQPDFETFDLSSWRVGAYGAAPMPLPTIQRLAQTLPRLQLMNVYGATETTSPSTLLPPEYAQTRPNSVGLPAPGCEILIMDGDGRELAPGAVGEVWIKGPMVAKGYWNNPFATDKEFVGGFWKSGDLGSLDAEGFLHVHDRQKDMINRGGYKIFSAEVEEEIAAHPAVLEAAVVARECPILGERVHAVVTLRAGFPDVDEAVLRKFVDATVADYKRPESWTIGRAPLPRNANGKVIKAKLREQLAPVPLRSR